MKKILRHFAISSATKAEFQQTIQNQLRSQLTESETRLDARFSKLDQRLDTLATPKARKWFNLNSYIDNTFYDVSKYVLAIGLWEFLVYTAHHPDYTRIGFAALVAVVFSYCGVRMYRSFTRERKEAGAHGQVVLSGLQTVYSVSGLVGALLGCVCSLVTSPNQTAVFGLVAATAVVAALYNYRQAIVLLSEDLGRKAKLHDLLVRVSASSIMVPPAGQP